MIKGRGKVLGEGRGSYVCCVCRGEEGERMDWNSVGSLCCEEREAKGEGENGVFCFFFFFFEWRDGSCFFLEGVMKTLLLLFTGPGRGRGRRISWKLSRAKADEQRSMILELRRTRWRDSNSTLGAQSP